MEKNKRYRNYSIKTKLLISHGVILGLCVIITFILLSGMIKIKDKVDYLYERPMKNIDAVGELRFAVTDVLRAMNQIMAEDKRDLTESYALMEGDVEKDVDMLLSAVNTLDGNLLTEKGEVLLGELMTAIDQAEKIRPEIMDTLKSGNFEKAYDLNNNIYIPMIQEINEIGNKLSIQIKKAADDYYWSAQKESMVLFVVGSGLVIGGIILALVIIIRITKAIVDPIKQITTAAKRMYQGDMGAGEDIIYESEDEIGVVAASLRGAMKNLQNYIEEISLNLREIAQGNLTKDFNRITDFLGDFANIKESFVYI